MGHAVKGPNGSNDLDLACAAKPVPKLVVRDRPPVLVKSPEAKRHVTAHKDSGERGHRAFQEMARRINFNGRELGGAVHLWRLGSPGGHGAHGGDPRSETGQNALKVPGIQRVILVEHHHPLAAGHSKAPVPVGDGP